MKIDDERLTIDDCRLTIHSSSAADIRYSPIHVGQSAIVNRQWFINRQSSIVNRQFK
jgi:hypothetical protein